MTTASQTPPQSEALAASPANPDVPAHLVVHVPEPQLPTCITCGDGINVGLVPCPRGRRYPSGAQVMYCRPCMPPSLPVQAATGVINAAMKNGNVTPADIAQAEEDAGLLVDLQAVQDIAAAAAEQAHAEDAAEIRERGRQLARMAGAQRKVNAVLRLCEGRPGTHRLTVAEIAAAAEYATTPLDAFPLQLAWTGDVAVPYPGDARTQAVVDCVSPYGSRVGVIVEDRLALASLLGAQARDVHAACPTKGCGDSHDFDPADMYGWARLEVPGIADDRPRWYCSAACVSAALARAGEELAAADDLDARYGPGASDEYALQVAEATEQGFEDERGDVDVDEDGAL